MYYDVTECGRRIRNLRNLKKMTQEQLGDALNITQGHLRKVEMGISGASVDLLVDISSYFDVSLDYLILGKDRAPRFVKEGIVEAIRVLSVCADKL